MSRDGPGYIYVKICCKNAKKKFTWSIKYKVRINKTKKLNECERKELIPQKVKKSACFIVYRSSPIQFCPSLVMFFVFRDTCLHIPSLHPIFVSSKFPYPRHHHYYHLAIKFLNTLLKVDRFFFILGVGREILEAESNVSSELVAITVGIDTGTSGNPAATFDIGVVIGVILDIVIFFRKDLRRSFLTSFGNVGDKNEGLVVVGGVRVRVDCG